MSAKMPSVLVTDRASGALFANGRGDTTHYNSTAEALLALASFLGRDIGKQVATGRRLAQQPAAKLSASDMVATGCAHAGRAWPGKAPTALVKPAEVLRSKPSGREVQPARRRTALFLSPSCYGTHTLRHSVSALGQLQLLRAQACGGASVLFRGQPAPAQEGRPANRQHSGRHAPNHLQQRLWERVPGCQGRHDHLCERRPVARHLLGAQALSSRQLLGPACSQSARVRCNSALTAALGADWAERGDSQQGQRAWPAASHGQGHIAGSKWHRGWERGRRNRSQGRCRRPGSC